MNAGTSATELPEPPSYSLGELVRYMLALGTWGVGGPVALVGYMHGASEPFAANQDDLAEAEVLDVRRAGMFDKAETLIAGAQWRDPAAVGAWAREVSRDKEIVVYCVYGHEVGRATTLRLRAQGVNARFLRGGIDAWQAAGRPLDPKEGAS
jgi:superoxide dismutase, Fe-Mn family